MVTAGKSVCSLPFQPTLWYNCSRVFAIALTRKTMAFVFLRKGYVYDQTIVVLASDCHHTFLVPRFTEPQRDALEHIVEQYHKHRCEVMLVRQEGLTKTYNRFHDPAERSADIVELQRLHVEMDDAILAAYEWTASNSTTIFG